MGRTIRHPKEIFPDIVDAFKGLFDADLVSIILYGSAACDEYDPGKSDINFMVVLTEDVIDSVDLAFGVVAKWKKRNVATPLFMTEGFLQTSLDVFPIEYLNFQNNYEVVYGKDIFEGLTFDPSLVRLQCEREIKGKLLLLREAFVETGGRGRDLQHLVSESLGAFVAIFNGLLYLEGKDLPHRKRQVVREVCGTFDLDGSLFERLLDIKEKRVKPPGKEIHGLFKDYLKEIRKLCHGVDRLGKGVGA